MFVYIKYIVTIIVDGLRQNIIFQTGLSEAQGFLMGTSGYDVMLHLRRPADRVPTPFSGFNQSVLPLDARY